MEVKWTTEMPVDGLYMTRHRTTKKPAGVATFVKGLLMERMCGDKDIIVIPWEECEWLGPFTAEDVLAMNKNLRRAIFVYEAARLEAEISCRPIVPEPWEDRDEAFRQQCVDVVEKQCGDEKFPSAGAAHDSWWREYERMGWVYGPERDIEKKTHPDMVPFDDLPKSERDKDEIFLRLCAVAEAM